MLADQIVQIEDLASTTSPIVFDHMGRPGSAGVRHPAFRVICKLLDKCNTWVSLFTCIRIREPARLPMPM
jgi:predicted TIM-barrel fold metal-dependent hydrolase